MTSESKNGTKDLVVFPYIFVISQQRVFRHMTCPLDA
jgi:hypothetical protein